MDRHEHLVRFYSIFQALEQRACRLADCSGRMNWPTRGVYFFRESGESRRDTGQGLRVVRVGTHALKIASGTKFWTRLSQHRGPSSTGGGNHRGSIFRLIVGAALIRRDSLNFPTWGSGNTAKKAISDGELDLEREVSRVIGDMSFLWVRIADEAGPRSHRGFIERNSIALLSNYKKPELDPPSEGWLGYHSDRERVRKSGLWNQNHVEETYDPTFLITLARLAKETVSGP
jgi:hypothetical protein